ncbi:MAG: SDR family oxidoreductase [Deltaproteobacteria bacterium]|nr:SDR family oxidoreductase [Deltaproteobacteria bacterium]
MKLKDKVAVITGAGRGLGRAIAIAMAREGANVAVMSRTLNELNAVEEEIASAGGRAFVFKGDISRQNDVGRMVAQTTAIFKGVDILVNNAAVIGPARFIEDTDPEAWDRTIAINLNGAYYCCHAVVPLMINRGGGKIISITSGLGKMPYPRFCAYGVSKAGIIQITRSLSEEFKEMNIQINAIDPGVMDTGMQAEVRALGPDKLGKSVYGHFMENKEQGLLKKPALIAELAVFLASPEADNLTGFYGRLDEYRKLGWRG